MSKLFLGLFLLALPSLALAQGVQLGSYKDRMFSLPQTIEARDNGAFRRVDYREGRDVNGRDEIAGRRVRSRYVSLRPRRTQQDLTLDMPFGPVPYTIVGKQTGASVVTIYVHGRGGDRRQGMNDYSFGGNFNRLKNLMVRNGGAHIAASMPEDPAAGVAVVEGLMDRHGGARNVVVACGSQAAVVCAGLMNRSGAVQRLAGIVLLGGAPDSGMAQSLAARSKVPVFIGHGSRDTVYPVGRAEQVYSVLRRVGVPTRMVVFESGIHGTPIRMVDWRETLNWMLSGGRG